MKGTVGRDGLEKQFDSRLQGQAGGAIFRVDPSGYKVNPPLEQFAPPGGIRPPHLARPRPAGGGRAGARRPERRRRGARRAHGRGAGPRQQARLRPEQDFRPTRSQATVADIDAAPAPGWTWPSAAAFRRAPPSRPSSRSPGCRPAASTRPTSPSTARGGSGSATAGFRATTGGGTMASSRSTTRSPRAATSIFGSTASRSVPTRSLAQARRMHLDGRTGIELPGEYRSLLPDRG